MADQPIASVESTDAHDNPLARLELLAGDDDAIASFLDEIDVHSPREREMLSELARTSTIAYPERFSADHRRALVALETLRRHGFHGSRAAGRLGRFAFIPRWGVELVARWIVVSYVKSAATDMRNLYWFREMEAPDGSPEVKLMRPARMDAQATIEIVKGRALGLPAFVIGGLLIPIVAALYRLTTGFAFQNWVAATIVGLIGVAVGLSISWVVLRGTATASRRIKLTTREPLRTLWASVGYCGTPPRNQARKFAIVAVSLTIGAWIVLPAVVGIALAR